MKPKDLPLFRDKDAKKVMAAACEKHGVPMELFRALLEVQRNYAGMGKQQGISMEFDERLSQYLDQEEVA